MRSHNVNKSQIGGIGDNWTINGGITIIKKVIASPIGIVSIIMLLVIIALANFSVAQEQLTEWFQPRAFPKEQKGEVLIVIATFHHTEGIADTAAHNEIKSAIESESQNLNFADLRVEVAPDILESADRDGAQRLGDRYDASIVIWGADTGVRVSVNFYNHKQPNSEAADVKIEETVRTQIVAPREYAEFITQDLPNQLVFLSLFAVGQSYYVTEAYTASAQIVEAAVACLGNATDIEGAAEAHFLLGRLYETPLCRADQALANYTRAIDLNPGYAMAYSSRGDTYSDMGEHAEALNDYTRAIELNPNDEIKAMIYNNRGNIYAETSDYERALADYTQALEFDPELEGVYDNRGSTYGELGKYDLALTDFTHALNLNPKYIKAYYNRGLTYTRMNNYEEALADYTRALKLDPQYVAAYNNRGLIYHKIGKHEAALAEFTLALKYSPGEAKTYNNRGNTYSDIGDYEKALTDYTRALELDPELDGAYINRGGIYQEMGDYAKALTDYTRALELDPELDEAYTSRGDTYQEMGNYVNALADYTRALEFAPKDAEIYNNRGFVYTKMGSYENALTDLSRSAELMPHPLVYTNIARVYALKNSPTDACSWLEKAIALDTQGCDCARTDPDFDLIRNIPCFQSLMNENSP